MDIIVNDERIDFTLENEKTLGEVVKALEAWLKSSNLIVTSVKLGNRDIIEESEDSWAGIPVESVDRLKVAAKLLQEIQLANMLTIIDFLNLLSESIEKSRRNKLDELIKGYGYMITSLRKMYKYFPELEIEREIDRLEKLLAGSTCDGILAWPKGIRTETLNGIESIIDSVAARIDEIKDPLHALAGIAENLKKITIDIGEVSVLLQTGQDREAMSSVIRFSDLSQKILRILTHMEETSKFSLKAIKIGDSEAETFFSELNGVLRELTAAFNSNDSVLIGDLLEYEIAPRLEMFVKFTEEITDLKSLNNAG